MDAPLADEPGVEEGEFTELEDADADPGDEYSRRIVFLRRIPTPATLRTCAAIYDQPRRVAPGVPLIGSTEIDRTVAQALRFWADLEAAESVKGVMGLQS